MPQFGMFQFNLMLIAHVTELLDKHAPLTNIKKKHQHLQMTSKYLLLNIYTLPKDP